MKSSNFEAFVDKYMILLSVDVRPEVHLRSNLGARWLGRCEWRSSRLGTSVIELQRSILADERTLERVLAHEMVHHWEFVNLPEHEIALIRLGHRPPGHGPRFREGAAIVNAVMGEGFVTETSDQEYVKEANTKEFYLLIDRAYGDRLGYAWAAKLSPEARKVVEERTAKGAKLVKTTDERFTIGKAKIKKFGGLSIPKEGSETEAVLRALWEGGA